MRETSHQAFARADGGQWAVPVITGLGGPAFHATLLAGLRDLVGADHVTDLSYDRAGGLGQCSAASLLNQSMIEWTTNLYVNGSFYRRDPNYQMLCGMAGQRRRSEDLIVETLCPEGIPDAEYRRLLFERPGFASKISVIGARDDGVCYINLYFSRRHGAGVEDLLRGCAPLLIALSRRHRELRCPVEPACAGAESWASGFSLREIQVAGLLRRGHTAKQVGRELGLSPATVVTYKNRIFKKCQVASLKEFLLKTPSPAAQERIGLSC